MELFRNRNITGSLKNNIKLTVLLPAALLCGIAFYSCSAQFCFSLIDDSLIDWNDEKKIEYPYRAGPIVFSMDDKSVNVIRETSGEKNSFLKEFDLFTSGEDPPLSNTLGVGTITLFLDLDGNGKLSNGKEWLYDQNENAYQILSKPLIDSNQNGWFDYTDNLWHVVMFKEENQYYTPEELGISAINWSNFAKVYGHKFMERQHANCEYIGMKNGIGCKKVSENYFQITSYNQDSVLLVDGRTLDSYGAVIDDSVYWNTYSLR